MATEQQIQSKMTKYLESQGAYAVKVVAASKSGVPDILACYRGRFLGIEVKTPRTQGNTSKLQDYNLEIIEEAEGYSLVAWEVDQLIDLLQKVDEEI